MSLFTSTLSSKSLLAAALVLSLARSSLAACSIDGLAGSYSQHLVADFSGSSSGDNVASIVNGAGLKIDTYAVPRQNMQYGTEQVTLVDGALRLTVKADDGSGTQKGAHLTTNAQFQYGSIRTVLKSSTTKGVVEGMFFYESDNAEFDWEILTATALEKNPDSPYLEAGIWATNQAIAKGGEKSAVNMDPGFDPSQGFHEYRIDWDSEATTFYIDGVQRTRITSNVPQVTGPFCLNTWSSGDLGWSAGPPTTDSHTFIKSFEMFYGYSATQSEQLCNSFRNGGTPGIGSPATSVSSASAIMSSSSSSSLSSSQSAAASSSRALSSVRTASTSSMSTTQQTSTSSSRPTSENAATSTRVVTSSQSASSSRFSTVYTSSRLASSTVQQSSQAKTSSSLSSSSSVQKASSPIATTQPKTVAEPSPTSPTSSSTPITSSVSTTSVFSSSSTPRPSSTSTYVPLETITSSPVSPTTSDIPAQTTTSAEQQAQPTNSPPTEAEAAAPDTTEEALDEQTGEESAGQATDQ